ncbi:Dps family protein [Pseudomonas matsuisoli]|uniref:DNA starvation/stationary phase protection protein n=1 Tax=Pseudomonas matsuisoli TaxID=1515666 RepID=A0A917Q0H6_9PSED|nr:DNA starvation/stationary phase protection protein [Pseudomonas matsuisoli]GGK03832.1 DNA starvation/stationary phase protection protein [Pseudomonas matsuisoli]
MAIANAKQELKSVQNVANQARAGKDAGISNHAEIGKALSVLLSDAFALYVKTKNYHWHVAGPHFRDYHLLLEQQADQIFEITDDIAERARKIGEPTIRSLEQMVAQKRIASSEVEDLSAHQMLKELQADNEAFAAFMRTTHTLTSDNNDLATTSMLEEWIDQAERRAWFLRQSVMDR